MMMLPNPSPQPQAQPGMMAPEAVIQQLRAPQKPGGIRPMPRPGMGPPSVTPGFRGGGKAAMAPSPYMARR